MNQKVAIFDMDGTLVDSMFIWSSMGTGYLRDLGYALTQEMEDKMRVMSLRETCQLCVDTFALSNTTEELMAGIYEKVRHFYEHDVTLKAGVDSYLQALEKQGVAMYVATATDLELAETAIKHVGIGHYFKGILTCAQAGRGKDYPAIFLQAMEAVNGHLESTVVYEDSLVAIRTAKKAGFQVVGIFDQAAHMHQTEIQSLADVYIQDFTDLLNS